MLPIEHVLLPRLSSRLTVLKYSVGLRGFLLSWLYVIASDLFGQFYCLSNDLLVISEVGFILKVVVDVSLKLG